MKALAKVYPFLGSIRFLALLLAVFVLGFAAYLGLKSVPKSSVQLRCSHNDQVSFTAANIPHTLPLLESLEIHSFECEGQKWGVTAVKAVYISDAIADLVERNRIQKEPLLGFVQDSQDKEYIVFISSEGELTVSSVAWLLKNASMPHEKGIEVKLPSESDSLYFKIWPSAY